MFYITLFSYILIFFIFVAIYFANKDKWKIVWWIMGIELVLSGSLGFLIPFAKQKGIL